MVELDFKDLHGDDLTRALDGRNTGRWNRIDSVQKIVIILLVAMLTAQLTGVHVTDPTFHIPLPVGW